MKNTGKFLMVVFLMCLAIYQAGELWFEDFSSHNFFWFGNFSSSFDAKDVGYITDRLIVNLGDSKVVCKQSDIYNKRYKKDFDTAVGEAMSRGDFVGQQELDWNTLLKKRAVFYQYSFNFKGTDSADIFKATVKVDTLNKITDYNTIILLPTSDGSEMQLIFYNTEKKTNSVFNMKNSDVISKCYEDSELLGKEEQKFSYISTVLNGFTIFDQNIFIPTWANTDAKYNQLEPYNYLEESNGVEKNADVFFDNPIGKTATKSKGVETFGDESTVVKYYSSGVLEYSNYKVETERENTFANNYISALSVLKKDVYLDNEFYLDSYTVDNNGNYIFYFDYKTEDLKLKPAESLSSEIGMNSFIEITAVKGRVSKYKKYAVSYKKSNSIATASTDYIGAIDKLYSRLYGSSTPKPVSDVELCYLANGKTVDLNWIIDIDGEEYITSTR